MKTTQKTAKKPSQKQSQEAVLQTKRDFISALLIVSVSANMFFVCLWVALQVTSRYDDSLAAFFINR